jgi:ferric-dicitrate binding protein FerR (iron transport regulator)
MSTPPPDKLHDRLLALLDGTLDSAGIQQLDAELKASREARDLFRQLATLHSALEEQGEAKFRMARTLIPMERLLADQRRGIVRKSLVAAAAVLLLSALALWVKMVPRATATLGEFRVGSGAVFSVEHSEDRETATGNELGEGSRLRLGQGTIEVKFVSGVRCVLEGPADLKLLAGNRVRLPEGSAWFEVPPPAVGFTVETQQLTAVDLGTRFGVLARPDQGDQVHVIEGVVAVNATGADDDRQPLALKAGDAREALADGGFREIDIHPGEFVTALPNPITFVDADASPTTGNTALDGPGSFGPTTSLKTDSKDGKWGIRTYPGVVGGSVIASGINEDAEPRLRTTFRLPEEGRYAIYGYFWNNEDGTGAWDAAFQLGSRGGMKTFSRLNAVNLASYPEEFTTAVPTHDGNGPVLLQAALGVWNTSRDGSEVTVFIDEGDSGIPGRDLRTWYDGVGFRRLPDP